MGTDTVKIALVGCGRVVEELHLPALGSVPEAEVSALADVDAQRLHAVGDRFGVARRTTDFRELLDDPQVALFGVCVPPERHTEVALPLIQAGRHVLVEKPPALTLEDCERLVAAAREAGVHATVGFNLRRHRLVEETRARLRSGVLGRVELVTSTFTSDAGLAAGPPAGAAPKGSDTLLERGVHHFDLWRHLLGDEVQEVSAIATGDHTVVVCARSAGGVLLAGHFSERTATANELAAYGSEGQLHLSCDRFDGLEVIRRPAYRGDPMVRVKGAMRALAHLPAAARGRRHGGDMLASYASGWRELIRAIAGGGRMRPTLEDGRRAVAILLAAKASLAGGACVRVEVAASSASGAAL